MLTKIIYIKLPLWFCSGSDIIGPSGLARNNSHSDCEKIFFIDFFSLNRNDTEIIC